MKPRRDAIRTFLTTLAALLASAALLAQSACSQPPEPGTQDENAEPDGQAIPRPGLVASSSQVMLTPEEIRERTGQYMALNLWADTARRTAEQDPTNFHQTLFSQPSQDCVEKHRDLMKTTPTPPLESLITCGENSAARGQDGNWNAINQQEREERAQRSAGLLFWSIDPPSLISVALAHDRGLDVNVRTNPEFARFAAEYNACEEMTKDHAMELAKAETSEQMAKMWLRADAELKACSDSVTTRLFK